jgi:aclacinomycin oxidase
VGSSAGRPTSFALVTIYVHLTNAGAGPDAASPDGGMLPVGYGGQVQAVPPGGTALAQRDVVMKAVQQATWADEADDTAELAWIRAFHHALSIELPS